VQYPASLLPLSLEELQAADLAPLDIPGHLYRGFYPRAIIGQIEPSTFYRDYVATYVERDLRQLSLVKDLAPFQTFLRLCASNIGQILNLNRMANDCGISQTTATEWLTLLEASYVLTRLQPYHSNTRKRLVKRPKLYFYDTGLAAYLLSLAAPSHVESHPLQGSLFENLVVMEVLKFLCNHNHNPQLYFYRDSDGNEVDLLIPVGNRLLPVEIKLGKTISQDFFKGFQRFETAMNMACPDKLLVYGGTVAQQRSDGTAVLPLANLAAWLKEKIL
jgi:predicted AAA+ superfamily ATPase